jgi:hypothetical protein
MAKGFTFEMQSQFGMVPVQLMAIAQQAFEYMKENIGHEAIVEFPSEFTITEVSALSSFLGACLQLINSQPENKQEDGISIFDVSFRVAQDSRTHLFVCLLHHNPELLYHNPEGAN